jgi:hypothetical protein
VFKKALKTTTILGGLLLLSVMVIQVISAQVVTKAVDQDYVSNSPDADNNFVVSITDTDVGATIAGKLTIKNLTSATSTTVDLAQVSGSSYTATISVISTVSTPGVSITAADGDHIQISYEDNAGSTGSIVTPNTRLAYVIVDATGPTITAQVPADTKETNTVSPTFKASIADAASGLGTTPGVHPIDTDFADVEANVIIIVGASEAYASSLTGQTAGVWIMERTTSVTSGANSWQVRATDALGNETLSTAITLILDEDGPTIESATTGVTIDADSHLPVLAPTNRKAIELLFDGGLDHTAIEPSGDDFRVELSLGSGALSIASASHDNHATSDARVYLTMTDDLPPGATPLISVIGIVKDNAFNANDSGLNTTAVDGLSPTLTASMLVSSAEAILTNLSIDIRLVSDEAGVEATQTSDPPATTGLLVQTPEANGTVFTTSTERAADTFTVLSAGTQWSWEFTFATDGTEDGLYNVSGAVLDFASGNSDTSGNASDSGGSGAVTFQVDTGVPAPTLDFSTDDSETFVEVNFAGEATEYTGDTYATVSGVTATVDGTAVTINSVDNIKYSFAAPSGGYSVGEHLVDVTATDSAGNTVTFDDLKVTIVERSDISIALRPGLNMISLPGAPASSYINDVIPAAHDINQVFSYDPSQEGGWLVAERGDDGLFAGTLTTISSGLGYFVRSSSFDPLSVSVPRVSASAGTLPPAITLKEGWNLVPVSDPTGDLAGGATICADTYLQTIAQIRVYRIDDFGKLTVVDTSACSVNDAGENVSIGKGYWVYVAADSILIP